MRSKLPQLSCLLFVLALLQAVPSSLYAQHFLNGSFEQNDYGCAYNLANSDFDQHVPYVTALGTKSEMDVITDTCGFGPAFEGKDFVALYGGFYLDAIALELDEALLPGKEYVLLFASKDGLGVGLPVGKLRIGFSVEKSLGELKYKSEPAGADWTEQKLVFTADAPYRYVGIVPDGDGWVFVDDFRFGCPDIELGNDTVLCKVAGTVLSISNAFDSQRWNTGATTTSIVADGPGLYSVEGYYDGCVVKDSILLSELENQCECPVYFPNAFSPTGDGINDDFRAFTPCQFLVFELLIFDRWGQLVYRTNDSSAGWEGLIGHKQALPGVYTFLSRYRFSYSNFWEMSRGELMLLR
ncbi:MAG: T9SS type B sorting domain-containing protein [Bacteroidetes bacterium]|nr:T9SS type B sorting domain-containing protein [Bacteroidota bacterium]